ncbi:MAG: VanZ family protein [Lachnospiraceae bacterium]|jgi:VanZ family protein
MKRVYMERRQKIWLVILLVYIAIVYGRSIKPAAVSSQESGFVLAAAVELFDQAGLPSGWLTDHIVRKTAHFTEYAGLGLLLFINLRSLTERRVRWQAGMFAVVVIPFLDETIQLFAAGRAAMIQDVWLDISGEVFGLVIAAAGAALWQRIRRKH